MDQVLVLFKTAREIGPEMVS